MWRHAGNKKNLPQTEMVKGSSLFYFIKAIVLFRVKHFVISFDSFSEYSLYLQLQ